MESGKFFLKSVAVLGHVLALFGGELAYVAQYFHNKNIQQADGFSLYVYLLKIISSIFKVAYWCLTTYDVWLFLQNFVNMMAIFVMIHQSIEIENKRNGRHYEDKNFADFDVTWIWHWTNMQSFVTATALMLTVTIFLSLMLGWVHGVVEILAITIFLTDATLTLPQFVKNYRRKSTFGVNKTIVSMWIAWDLYRTIYAMFCSTPGPFYLAAVVTFFIDLGVLSQIYHYSDARP